MFSDKILNAKPAYTYDDFLLVPNASWIEAKDVETTVKLTKDIKLNIPIMSAAMDTVTEARLAIALAQEGGIGVIHRNITQEAQVEEVRKVKKANDIIKLYPQYKKQIKKALAQERQNEMSKKDRLQKMIVVLNTVSTLK